ncbi:hypothetical protein [Rhizobium sp. 2YAF20]|uniref:hypothetical protein n=1 Tax=Rhizobium sp. 2YAF20 TaxID=3233027 RepID=UPI003F9890D9
MEASDQALRRIDAALADRPIEMAADAIADIGQAVGGLPEGFQYSVYDQDGRLRFSSYPHAELVNVSDREYFKRLKAGAAIDISPQLVERVSHRSVFVVARRIERSDGLRGVATIAIPTSKMDEPWATMSLGPSSTVSIVREDGLLVARYPSVPDSLDMRQSALFNAYPKAAHGVYHSDHSPADGIARVIGYWKVEHWPLVAVAGMERGYSLQLFWSTLVIQLAFALPVIVLLLAGAFSGVISSAAVCEAEPRA